jgi:7-keto-8-aminopelargonate synthetase-like enzyme
MIEYISQYDLSCPASNMVMQAEPSILLEKTIAEFHGMKESIIFTNGYSANVNVIQALGTRINTPHMIPYFRSMGIGKSTNKTPTIFFIDSESHYSLVQGMRNAKSLFKDKCIMNNFPSGDYDKLTKDLQKSIKHNGHDTVRIIVSDTLSSTTGKVFDVGILCKIAEEFDCLLYIDEAHAVGAMGPQGRGIAANFSEIDKYNDRIILMGTLTKTFCQLGGYVTMSNSNLCWFLRVCSPQYIFSAPVPPWMAKATVNIINLVKEDFGEKQRHKLYSVSKYMRDRLLHNGFNILGSESQIIPVLIGNQAIAEKIRVFIEKNGFVVSLFKYPAVPKNSSLIRFSLCADITQEEVDEVLRVLLLAREKYCF